MMLGLQYIRNFVASLLHLQALVGQFYFFLQPHQAYNKQEAAQIQRITVARIFVQDLSICKFLHLDIRWFSKLPPVYYTLDEVAKKSKTAPPKLADAIGMLQNSGYAAGATSFNPTGFRTNATFEQITACIL